MPPNSAQKLFEIQLQKKYAKQKKETLKLTEGHKANRFGHLYPFRKALEYLAPFEGDYLRLMLISKEFYKELRRPLMRNLVIRFENQITLDRRVKLWESLVGAKKRKVPTLEEVEKMGVSIEDVKQTIVKEPTRPDNKIEFIFIFH
jgi:hypothetical protein